MRQIENVSVDFLSPPARSEFSHRLFSPRWPQQKVRVAERRLNAAMGRIQASLRDAKLDGTLVRGLKPHGYRHQVALRLRRN